MTKTAADRFAGALAAVDAAYAAAAKESRNTNSNFGSKGVFECELCEKKTRATGKGNESVNLCTECYDECERENARADDEE